MIGKAGIYTVKAYIAARAKYQMQNGINEGDFDFGEAEGIRSWVQSMLSEHKYRYKTLHPVRIKPRQ